METARSFRTLATIYETTRRQNPARVIFSGTVVSGTRTEVNYTFTDVSEERTASIFRVEEIRVFLLVAGFA
jgi:hypothetical protein